MLFSNDRHHIILHLCLFYLSTVALLNGRRTTIALQRSLKWWVKVLVSVSAMLVYTRQKNIAQVFILERYFFVSIYPAAIPGTYLAMFLVAVLQLC